MRRGDLFFIQKFGVYVYPNSRNADGVRCLPFGAPVMYICKGTDIVQLRNYEVLVLTEAGPAWIDRDELAFEKTKRR